MNATELKETLMTYKNNNFQMDESISISELTTAMLREIGNVDPELRDELIYSSFSQLILEDSYSDGELKRILTTCMDTDHLFYKIGEIGKDSVFTRSFSSLIIAMILLVNLQKNFLASNDIEQISVSLLKYLDQEQDIRGLVHAKGWAHSIAHVADALDELVKQPNLSIENAENVFTAIFNKMAFNKDYFHYEEDERMANPVIAMLQRGFSESMVCEKIAELANELKQNFSTGDQAYFVYRANIKQFLRSLYFHLETIEKNVEVRNSIKQALEGINQPYYQM
ncbi:DUF2785 domain-containing protein [Virgibacillus necropolis]|uniref:DUF2785 domain-containing protein n=1 Tax=Virgibacillus necropolis TaxID=163877 RepID=A0A221MH13_9BACI|nr:DUF2785 domain-containing protein [Virgibacillus necropolis]ASN06958.1 hypothetical protein CFK40_19040 [Virgibacillus necropolis]